MKDKILEVLDYTRNKALSKQEIYRKTGITNISYDDYLLIFNDLLNDKKIYCINSKDETYTLNPFKEGIFHIKRNGDCFVTSEGKTIIVKSQNKFNCLNLDKVLVRITDFNTYEGTVKDIIERHGIVGEVITKDNKRYVKVDENLYSSNIDDTIVDGMLVGIKIDKKKTGNFYKCTIERIIGHKNAPRIDEQIILYEFGFPVEFSEEAMECTKNLDELMTKEEISKRKDLRKEMIFTIDGDDTKDIDDAISIEKLNNGNYNLGVHIADVSFYVKENSKLDEESFERTTSVYMPGVVSPMYPPVLSNGVCSLNPNVDRFAISCQMIVTPNGEITSYDIFKSIIHSNIQMTYKKVNKVLDENIIPDGYAPFKETLVLMNKVALILRNNRTKKGMLNFDSDEIKILVDETGKVTSIEKRIQGTGESMIEDFMLAANESVATYLQDLGVHSLYRVHETPDLEKLRHTLSVLTSYGEKINSKINDKDPKFIQNIIEEIKESDKSKIYSDLILRSMAKAKYQTKNEGHFGLGINSKKGEAYTHFTSPIRRYPDTTIHRILSEVLDGNMNRLCSNEYLNKLNIIAEHSSVMEVNADKCEREADDMKEAEYMQDHLNEEFEGHITGFTKNGMFVELSNYVEGRIDFSTMDDFYRYNEELEVVIGDRKKKVYRLGDKLKVTVTRADKESRQIDFELVKNKKPLFKDKFKIKTKFGAKKYGNTKQKSKF